MAKHELRLRVIFDGPADAEPEDTADLIRAALPGAEVIVDNHLAAKHVSELSDTEWAAIINSDDSETQEG